MAPPNILVLGSGGHARVVLDAIRARGEFKPLGFLDDNRHVGEMVDGLPVLGPIGRLPELSVDLSAGAVVAIGANDIRRKIVRQVEVLKATVDWLSVIHPGATIAANARIGAGAVVLAGCVINPGVSLGQHTIVNTRSSIDHDSVFGDFASTGPGVTTGGNTTAGAGTHIGIGATLVHGIRIGHDSVVGAGSVVTRDIGDLVVAYGAPAKVVRTRRADEKYL